jgi:hypothetical protein
LRIHKSGGIGDTIHLIINRNRRRLFSYGMSRTEVDKAINGNNINFLSEDNCLMADMLNRGIIAREFDKRSERLMRLDKLFDDVLVTETSR